MSGGAVFWLTGLSGAGKTTLATRCSEILTQEGIPVLVLDGDRMRSGLCADLGFGMRDRVENNRRCAEVAKIIAEKQICLCSFISPTKALRATSRAIIGDGYREIYIRCPLATCIRRDPKGNYAKALAGLLPGYTGIDAPYEEPEQPDLIVDTGQTSLDISVHTLLAFIHQTVLVTKSNSVEDAPRNR